MSGRAQILAPGPAWDQALARLAAHGQADVYFDHRYMAAYHGPGQASEAFTYGQGEDLFFLPYLRRPLPEALSLTGGQDFESAYGYGGPLSTSRDQAFLQAAWRAFAEHGQASGLVAGLLRFHNLLANHELVAGPPVELTLDRQTVVLPLGLTPAQVWQGYSADNRNKINKAIRAGLAVAAEELPQSALTLAGLYRQRMVELQAEPVYHFSDAYFLALAGLGPDRCRVYLARHQGQAAVGGVMVLLSERFAQYHLSACPLAHRNLAVNNLLRHVVIHDLLGAGRQWLNFGGGRTSRPDDELLAFKMRFSPHRRDYYFGRCVLDPAAYQGLCQDWACAHPELVPLYGRRILCYRYQPQESQVGLESGVE